MKKLFLVALAAVGLASCVQNEELAVAGGNVAIAFGDSYVHNATKADPTTTTETIEGFDVWAFMDEVGGTVLADEDVTKSGGAWGYANIQYWAPNHTYYFAALSPMNSANITSKTLAAGEEAKLGLGEIAFTNVAGTEDLLYAKEKAATPATLSELTAQGMDAVEMEFQHLLSKVKFTFQNGFGTSNMTVQVSDVAMKVANNAKIDLAVADYSKGWTGHAGETVLAFGDTEKLASAATGAAADERLTIPADATATYEVTFNVQVWSGSILALETAKTATISGYALEMGKAYNFTAVINNETLALPAIEFTATVNGWDNVGDVAAYKWENDGFGLDTLTGIYHVTNLVGFDYFAAQVNGGRDFAGKTVVLDSDLDLSATRALAEWTPIGTVDHAFKGIFDGAGHKVSNFKVTAVEGFAGLFGNVHVGSVKNVSVENVEIVANHYAGAVVGKGYVRIDNCHAKNVEITLSVKNGDWGDKAGAILGQNGEGKSCYVKNCSAENVNIKGYRDLGGIVGMAHNDNTVSGCSVKDITIVQDLSVDYQDATPTTLGGVAGRLGANVTLENNTEEDVTVEGGIQIGDNNYLSLAEAVADAEDGATITLAANFAVAEPIVVEEGKSLTLDLNGKTLAANYGKSVGAVVKNNGTLTIVGGVISSLGANGGSAVMNNGTLTVKDATLNGAPNEGKSWPSYTVNNVGTMTIHNSTITSVHGAVCSYGEGAVLTLKNTNIEMSGIPGFTSHGIYTYNNGKAVVDGGNIANNAGDQGATGGSVINGHVEVLAGNFTGRIENYYGTPVLKGGAFSVKPKDTFLAEGYEAVEKDGKWIVVKAGAPVVDSSDALKEAFENNTDVYVTAGEYTFPASSVQPGATITCEEGTIFKGQSSLNIKGATVIGATFSNDKTAVSGTINGTLKNCIFEGSEALRYCYTNAGETAVFENCVIKTNFRGFHFDVMNGDVIFRNCEINGFNAFGGAGTITFEGCTFGHDNSYYNGLNTYTNVVIKDSKFVFKSGKSNFIDLEGTGKTMIINNCIATLDGATADVATFVGGSKKAQNTVIIDGKITAENAEQLAAYLVNENVSTILLKDGVDFGTIVMKSNKTVVGAPNAKVDAVNVNNTNNVTLKDIVFDAANAQPALNGKGKVERTANIITGGETYNTTWGCRGLVIDGCTFAGTFAQTAHYPGAIAITDNGRSSGQSGNITIKNCTFNTTGGYFNIGLYYGGYGEMNIENNTFKSEALGWGTIYLVRYQSSTPVVVKGNAFEKVASFEEAATISAHSASYTVSFNASNNTFAN